MAKRKKRLKSKPHKAPENGGFSHSEGISGVLLEIGVLFLGHLHIADAWIVWGLFVIGFLLIAHWLLRSNRSASEKWKLGIPLAIVFALLGGWTYSHSEKPKDSGEAKTRVSFFYSPNVDPKAITGFEIQFDNVNGTDSDHKIKAEIQFPVLVRHITGTKGTIEVVAGGESANYVTLYASELKPGEIMRIGGEFVSELRPEEAMRAIVESHPKFHSESVSEGEVIIPGYAHMGEPQRVQPPHVGR